MRIIREQSAGLVIDIQERLFPLIHNHDEMARNAGILISGLQSLNLPVLLTQQYTKGLGNSIPAIRQFFENQEHIEKVAFSCCDEPSFQDQLKALNRKFFIITGIETHVCVLQTAIDLLEGGLIPVVIEDCVSSRRENDKKYAIMRMRKEGAIVSTYESVLFELLRYSGTDDFRAISRLVK
jgi:nicotinamidase-related amidase